MTTMARAARATVIRGASPGGASSAALNKAKASGVGGGGHFESRSGDSSGTANLKGENAAGSASEHHVKAAAIAAHNYRPGGGAYAEFLKDEEVLEKVRFRLKGNKIECVHVLGTFYYVDLPVCELAVFEHVGASRPHFLPESSFDSCETFGRQC
ncbi:unnamed protein product [Linum tenue]|uniref:Uncharacterized protein n=1 Tax=Linum tenue TaxID=586396 RepID=A0AAV0PME1_9ROSI|nr:unnamed protein product [Linum tenue]